MLVFVLHYLDPPPHPRAYPDQFGQHLLDAFKTHVDAGPGRRDLRFKPQLNMGIPELIQFQLLPLGDVWEEANLLEPLTYLMESKKCRTDPNLFIRFMHVPCESKTIQRIGP